MTQITSQSRSDSFARTSFCNEGVCAHNPVNEQPSRVSPPHATESWKAAFGAHSCPGKNEDSVSGRNCEHG